jgi:hypothetical protein
MNPSTSKVDGGVVMIRSIIIVVLLVSLSASSLVAGTWSDGFQDARLKDWQLIFQQGPTTFKAENGELSMEVSGEIVSSLGIIGSDRWEDYILTVKVKILDMFGAYVDGGVGIHYTGVNFYYFFIAAKWTQIYPGVPPEGKGAFAFPVINGAFQMGKVIVFTPELDHWYTLKAVTQKEHTEFYIDNKLIGAFDYAELKSGNVGPVVSNAHVHFDDFVVIGQGIPDGGPGGVSISVGEKGKITTLWGNIKCKL